jgi:hypothetical protein
MSNETDETSNSVFPHREPPPSLGLVAHMWAGHLAPGETDDSVDADQADSIDLNPPRSRLFSID